MKFSVVILSKNLSNLGPCVAAVRENEPDLPAANIIVVDDDPTGKIDHFCASNGLTRVVGMKPFVFPRNVNIGALAAIAFNPKVEGFVLCNDDALLRSQQGFTLLHKAAQENQEYGCIGAVTNVTGQTLQFPRGVGLRRVPHIAYVCVYVPRKTFENVQWMDERYCLDYGCCDRDHCEAITRAGLTVGVHDGCYVDHGSLVSSFRGDPETPKSFARNYELLMQKWGTVVA